MKPQLESVQPASSGQSISQSVGSHSIELISVQDAPDDRERWYITHGLHTLLHELRTGWSALDTTQWRAWLSALLAGWLATAAFLLLLIAVMIYALQQGYLTTAGEQQALRWIIATIPMDFSHAVWMGAAGDPIVIIPVFIIGTIVAVRSGHPLRGLSIAAAYMMVSLLVLIGWTIWDRPRPTLVFDGAAAPDLHSFPSGHMAQSVAVYGMLWYVWLHKIRHKSEYFLAIVLFAVWISLIASSRLVLGAHWVTDIIAGTLIGLSWTLALVRALRRARAD